MIRLSTNQREHKTAACTRNAQAVFNGFCRTSKPSHAASSTSPTIHEQERRPPQRGGKKPEYDGVHQSTAASVIERRPTNPLSQDLAP
jgi:hypothetical protein